MKLSLPHWAGIAISLAAAILTWVMAEQASGNLVLPATLATLCIVVSKVLGLLTVSVYPAVNAKSVREDGNIVISKASVYLPPPPPDSTTEITQPEINVPRKP
jgi:hypothetical protein